MRWFYFLRSVPICLLVAVAACDCPISPSVRQQPEATAVSSLGTHNCALTPNGGVICWGTNFNGELGTGTMGDASNPNIVGGLPKISAVTTGDDHSCALDDTGQAWCWGSNHHGQLGLGYSDAPGGWAVAVPTRVTGDLHLVSLTAGAEHTCGLDPSGTAYCWGHNGYGQTGYPSPVVGGSPVVVPGNLQFTTITAASYYNCGLDTGGRVYCWGNYYGPAGFVGFHNTPTLVSDTTRFRSIDGGAYQACGVTYDNDAYCWGSDRWGSLGVSADTVQQSATPKRVMGGYKFSSVSAGDFFSCGIRLDGRAMCWGFGHSGELGNGTSFDAVSPVPVQVSGDLTFVSISAGGSHACAITTDGQVYCWGRLFSGAGDEEHPAPTRVRMQP